MNRSARILGAVILLLIIICSAVWIAAGHLDRRGLLAVTFLDVGQGDAILIDAPSGRRVLIDGGPADGGVLRALGAVMPWWDRGIDVIIATHPDADHSAGLIPVLRRYHIDLFVQSSVEGDTPTWDLLQNEVTRSNARVLEAARGQIIELGQGAFIEVLAPDRRVSGIETNTGCVVVRVVYGATAFMLPCDAPQSVEKYLVSLDGSGLKADVLKAGHHGSRTSSAPLFVGHVDPRWAVYSRGCENRYGFPHQETIDTYARFGIPVLDTCGSGTISFMSDGRSVQKR